MMGMASSPPPPVPFSGEIDPELAKRNLATVAEIVEERKRRYSLRGDDCLGPIGRGFLFGWLLGHL